MTEQEYTDFVQRKFRTPQHPTQFELELLHAAIGIAGEAGEVVDLIKKFTFGFKSNIQRERLVEELGDLEFYMESLRKTLDITRDEVLKANVNKLDARFPERK